jgi:NAD(P)-dependent dehydrogenase (short-subunit alcohol dehydrogenase family)
MTSLAGKVIAITGAAQGLGRATALAMGREGARLALTDVDGAGLAATMDALQALGIDAVSVTGDVTLAATHDQLLASTLSQFGGLHGLCNVAGVLGAGHLADVTAQSFDHVMHVNCFAQLLAIQRLAAALKASGQGAIVNVASVGAMVALPMMTTYCASKAAVIGLTRAVAAELSPHVRCNVVCPGGMDTPMARSLFNGLSTHDSTELMGKLTGRQMQKRFAKPEEVAQMLVFLVSNASSFSTGAVFAADGGHSAW